MKEYPQKSCTNCDKESGSWCVCKQCRKNAKTIKMLKTTNFQVIFDALTALCDAGYKLNKEERKTILKLMRLKKRVS